QVRTVLDWKAIEPSAPGTAFPATPANPARAPRAPRRGALAVCRPRKHRATARPTRRGGKQAASERDIVVEILGRGRRRAGLLLGARRCAGARPAAEHLHVVRDDLGRPTAVAVPILPLAGPQAARYIHLRALA